jgi:diguanylate cyclase (GGDEF)-like protein
LVLRYLFVHRDAIVAWVRPELVANGWHYLYTGLFTVPAMAALGWWAGRRTDVISLQMEVWRRATRRFRRLASTDELTGLLLRRPLLERLEEEVKRAQRYGHPLASLFVDVDNFKGCNDVYGHVAGDEVLRRVAEVVRARVRETDVVGRYGGDEFLAILPHAGMRESFAAAERIRHGAAGLNVSVGGRHVPVTVSVGVMACVPDKTDPTYFVDMADWALRRSKGEGKNCTILVDPTSGATALGPVVDDKKPEKGM